MRVAPVVHGVILIGIIEPQQFENPCDDLSCRFGIVCHFLVDNFRDQLAKI